MTTDHALSITEQEALHEHLADSAEVVRRRTLQQPQRERQGDPVTTTVPTITVYISIGNSDDKLSQKEWAEYYRSVSLTLHQAAATVHGQWVSEPAAAWQNACWCVELANHDVTTAAGQTMPNVEWVRERLANLACDYRQDAIAWAETTTEFIGAKGRAA